MATLEPRLLQNILEAIRKAKAPGSCSYGKGCVIAQLALIEGVSQEQLQEWDRGIPHANIEGSASISQIEMHTKSEDYPLGDYPIQLLDRLQDYWDSEALQSLSERRLKMTHCAINYQVRE